MGKCVATNRSEWQGWYRLKNQYGLLFLLISMGILLFFLGLYAFVSKTQQTSTINQQEIHVVGETFNLGNLQYKINNVRTSDSDANVVKPPKEGNIFLLLGVTIENRGMADAEIRSTIGFKLKDKEGRRQNFSMRAALAVKNAIDGTIPAGGKITGELGYEVMKGAQNFKLVVIPDPFSSKTEIATVEIPMQ